MPSQAKVDMAAMYLSKHIKAFYFLCEIFNCRCLVERRYKVQMNWDSAKDAAISSKSLLSASVNFCVPLHRS